METGNQAEVAAMQAVATAAAGDGGMPSRPGKEQVRRWLLERVANRQPLPEPEAIRRALGWTAVIAGDGTMPETPAAA